MELAAGRSRSADAERLEELRRFGVSESGARAYLALLHLGTTGAREIARLAGIPAAKVYVVLESLQERGLVRVLPETPRRYVPTPFHEFLARQRGMHEEAINDLQRREKDLVDLFSVETGPAADDRGKVEILRGRRTFIEHVKQSLAHAREEIVCSAAIGFPQRVAQWPEAFRAAADRGVRMRIVCPVADPAEEELLVRHLAFADVRVETSAYTCGDVGVLVFDRERAIVNHFVPADASRSQGKDIAIHTDEQGFVALLHAFASDRWSRGRRIVERAG